MRKQELQQQPTPQLHASLQVRNFRHAGPESEERMTDATKFTMFTDKASHSMSQLAILGLARAIHL
jgi:hypothetical protein